MNMNISRGGQQGKQRRQAMAIIKRPLLLALAIFMFFGVVVYLRLWIIDYQISADDSELLRRQFDLAHREAMDESAEWRSRFDSERERVDKCMKELTEVKESRSRIAKESPSVDERVERLEKENEDLLKRLESLKQELEAEKLKCKSH